MYKGLAMTTMTSHEPTILSRDGEAGQAVRDIHDQERRRLLKTLASSALRIVAVGGTLQASGGGGGGGWMRMSSN